MNITPINQNSFGMNIGSNANTAIEVYRDLPIYRDVISKNFLKALSELAETKSNPNYELHDINAQEHLFGTGVDVMVKDKQSGIVATITHFFESSVPRTLRKLKDDNYVSKLINEAKIEEEQKAKKVANTK